MPKSLSHCRFQRRGQKRESSNERDQLQVVLTEISESIPDGSLHKIKKPSTYLVKHSRINNSIQGLATYDSEEGDDILTFAEERLEDDQELKLHALSNQMSWKRFFVAIQCSLFVLNNLFCKTFQYWKTNPSTKIFQGWLRRTTLKLLISFPFESCHLGTWRCCGSNSVRNVRSLDFDCFFLANLETRCVTLCNPHQPS